MKRWRRWKARQRSALRLAVIPDGTRIAAHGLHPVPRARLRRGAEAAVNAHVAGRYVRLVPPGERARFSERVGAIRRVPLGRGWRILITPAVRR